MSIQIKGFVNLIFHDNANALSDFTIAKLIFRFDTQADWYRQAEASKRVEDCPIWHWRWWTEETRNTTKTSVCRISVNNYWFYNVSYDFSNKVTWLTVRWLKVRWVFMWHKTACWVRITVKQIKWVQCKWNHSNSFIWDLILFKWFTI